MNIRDIAKICNVGVSTVSRVINNHPDVKKETRELVEDAIKKYHYIPNNSARVLKQNNTNHIGVFVKGVYNPFFSEMLKIIGHRIEEKGYTMILHQYEDSTQKDADALISFIKEKRLQGVICLGGNFENLKEESFEALDVSIVLTSINTAVERSKDIFSVIGIDNEKAAYDATQYLIQKGHRHIALMIGDEYDAGVGNVRALGYMKALEANGILVNHANVLIGGYDFRPAYEAAKAFLQQRKEITAIFAISDIMAIGVTKAALEQGLRVPEDLSIMGFDGMDIARFYHPTIATIQQPQKEMAEKSVKLLLDLCQQKVRNQKIILETKLVEGNSCSKVRRSENKA